MSRSAVLFEDAKKYIPGGVNSPVRAFGRVGGQPRFFKGGHGARLVDEDGQDYVDYIGSWGPMIVGHAHPHVIDRVKRAVEAGLSFGTPTEVETILARKIIAHLPSIDLIRMVNSGTEATMSAIRLARGFTGRDTIVKFEGCYHGHSDALLVKAGSGALTLGEPDSMGVPGSVAAHTLTLEFNNIEQVHAVFDRVAEGIAAVIVEPVAGNMGCVPPVPGFLEALKSTCNRHGAVLIFDEVMTGFRVARGGAQAMYGVTPDLTTLGKIIGGGMPVGAFGGRRDIMEQIAPLGGVYQAGTLSGNPVAMHAGLATLELLEEDGFYEKLSATTEKLMEGFSAIANESGVPLSTNQVNSMFSLFFTSASPIRNFGQVMNANTDTFGRFFNAMLTQGINLAPSPFECGFVSAAHGEKEIELTLEAARHAFRSIRT